MEIQAIAQATKDRADATQIHTMLLRSMQQAIYTSTNSGHFGLSYDAYAHFTSPIRRYPDLLVHRVIKAILAGKRYQLDAALVASMPPAPAAQGRPSHQPSRAKAPSKEVSVWEIAGAHCSANERRADEASRDVEAWLKCRFMREHLGEEYAGTVSAITSFGLFVTLDALYVEGLVHITELGGEYYRFDEVHQELRGERSGLRYSVGSRVRVQVSRVDLDGRRIDFRLVRDGEPEHLPTRVSAASVRARRVPSMRWLTSARPTARARPARARRRRAGGAQRRARVRAPRRHAASPRPAHDVEPAAARRRAPLRVNASQLALRAGGAAHGIRQIGGAQRATRGLRLQGQVGGAAMQPGAGHGRGERSAFRLQLRPQATQPAGQHIAAAAAGQQGIAGGVDDDVPGRVPRRRCPSP